MMPMPRRTMPHQTVPMPRRTLPRQTVYMDLLDPYFRGINSNGNFFSMKNFAFGVGDQGNTKICYAFASAENIFGVSGVVLSEQSILNYYRPPGVTLLRMLVNKFGFGSLYQEFFDYLIYSGAHLGIQMPWTGIKVPFAPPLSPLWDGRVFVSHYAIYPISSAGHLLRLHNALATQMFVTAELIDWSNMGGGQGVYRYSPRLRNHLNMVEANAVSLGCGVNAHAIAIVGDGAEGGEEFFWLKNSWGRNIFHGGLFKMLRSDFRYVATVGGVTTT